LKIAIATMQRGRARYLAEWIAFHQTVGFDHLFIYSHGGDTLQDELLSKLSRVDPTITHYKVDGIEGRPQLRVYQHCWERHSKDFDAIAFIDGDEFIFSPSKNIKDALKELFEFNCSAVAAYWVIYGSSGLVKEPEDLIINSFRWHSELTHPLNRHFKTVLRRGEKVNFTNPHFFATNHGTIDELSRQIRGPLIESHEPSHKLLRINHYVTQSWEYFSNQKKSAGYVDRPDGSKFVRSDDWFWKHDLNHVNDGLILNYAVKTFLRREELLSLIV
jgi:hypothetical protein